MESFATERPADALQKESVLLDGIFGAGNYQIVDGGECNATISSADMDLTFTYDRHRTRDVFTAIIWKGNQSDWKSEVSLDVWAAFLDNEVPVVPTDYSGIATVTFAAQIHHHLMWIARFQDKIFSDPQRARDACFFAAGYLRAYNDRASRRGAWKE